MVNKNLVTVGKFKEVQTKQKLTSGFKIGFEWEVPYENNHKESILSSKKEYEEVGFTTHLECGGREFCSPVFSTLVQARSHARWLIKEVDKNKNLLPSSSGKGMGASDCGIHVHITHPKVNYALYQTLFYLLNHSSMKSFVWDISGRKRGGYARQAISTCWDQVGRGSFFTGMLKYNQLDTYVVSLELRLWAGDKRVLLPALDFAKACTEYALTLESPDMLDNKPLIEQSKGSKFASWLLKQKGYKELKKTFLTEIEILSKQG